MNLTNQEITIIASLIGFAGAIFGAFIQAYSSEIKFFLSKEKTNELTGTWTGFWDFDLSESGVNQETLKDIIKIKKVNKESFEGVGKVPDVGVYKIFGHHSDYSVSLLFHGIGADRNLSGVALLKKSPVNTRMEGQWWQFSRKGNFIGGKVCLQKNSEKG